MLEANAILDFQNFKFSSVDGFKRVELRRHAKLRRNQSNRCRDVAILLSVFQDGRRHLEILNFRNFNGQNAQEGQAASLCQISSKSVKPRPRYGDFLNRFFKMATAAIFDLYIFFKF